MKNLFFVLTAMFVSSSAMAKHLIHYHCTKGSEQFTLMIQPGNTMGYYHEAAGGTYAWTGSAKVGVTTTCMKDHSCYQGSIGATAIKAGAMIPKTLKHWSVAVPTSILNGAIRGKVVSSVAFVESKTYQCKLSMFARRE